MSTNSPSMFEYQAPGEDAANDGLFLERLDTFMEKSLGDIKAFAEREFRPYEETRRCIAQWHAKYLFQAQTSPSPTELSKDGPYRSPQVRAVLCDTSRILEGLSVTAGVQSFLLAVDPTEASDGGFLGGSVIGREFWRGLRGGGENGAKTFKAHCNTHLQNATADGNTQPPIFERHFSTPPPKAGPAKSIKNELYESVRTALRLASGVRNAEMKWSNPERLDVYGVRLVGWPKGIPAQNPSTLKMGQNKVLLEALQSGSMKFESFVQGHFSRARSTGNNLDGEDLNEDFSWAYDVDAGSHSPPQEQGNAVLTNSSPSKWTVVDTPPPVPVISTNESTPESSSEIVEFSRTVEVDPALSIHREHYLWDEANEHVMVMTMRDEYCDDSNPESPPPERPRKRPRCEEPGDSRIT